MWLLREAAGGEVMGEHGLVLWNRLIEWVFSAHWLLRIKNGKASKPPVSIRREWFFPSGAIETMNVSVFENIQYRARWVSVKGHSIQ